MVTGKKLSGERYIYVLLAFRIIEASDTRHLELGEQRLTGGASYYRRFELETYTESGYTILIEKKTGAGGADFSRHFMISNTHYIKPYISECLADCGDNLSKWFH